MRDCYIFKRKQRKNPLKNEPLLRKSSKENRNVTLHMRLVFADLEAH